MSDAHTTANEPPSRRLRAVAARSESVNGSRAKTTAVKSGRPSYDDYAKRVSQVLRWTPFQLEPCTTLAQLPGVQQRVRQKPTAMLPLGTALRSLVDEAVRDVEEVALSGRRGRLSHDEYAKAVAAVLRADLWQLEECAILGQLPGARFLAARQTRSVFPIGAAIRALLDRAVGEVVLLSLNQRDPASRRIAWFLQLWYKEGRTVVAAAEVLALSRSYVAHTVQPRALELVAKHLPDLAWRVEASA